MEQIIRTTLAMRWHKASETDIYLMTLTALGELMNTDFSKEAVIECCSMAIEQYEVHVPPPKYVGRKGYSW